MQKLILVSVLLIFTAFVSAEDWQTRAEKSGFKETSRYSEVFEYCRRLEKASQWIKFSSFGPTPEGRELPLLTISKDRIFSPEDAKKSGRIVLLVINGIHAGEIAGKEASLMLVRDIAVTRQKAALLDKVILLVVPIYNVDGHERFSPYNRINQNGPREMGWRVTSQNLNLNRDWLKADAPETRSMLKLYTSWLPHFVIDNHVTNGGDYQYDVMYIMEDSPAVAPSVLQYLKTEYEPFLVDALSKAGHTPTFYFDFVDHKNPAAGLVTTPSEPRFSNGYGILQNRPTIVAETHMLKTFQQRIQGHYHLMEATMKLLNDTAQSLQKAIRQADQESEQISGKEVPMRLMLNTQDAQETQFKGIEFVRELNPISGTIGIRYGNKPIEIKIPWYRTLHAEAVVIAPLGYVIPAQWNFVTDRLIAHGIEFQRLKKAVTGNFETYRFEGVSWNATPFEGHHEAKYTTKKVIEERTLPQDSVVVWLNQRSNRLIMHLLEPESPDSLVAWGFFNSIFEQKEYSEDYVMDKMAADMMKKQPDLLKEFEKKIVEDPQFGADPKARLNFFYERSPYWDAAKDRYPVVRIIDETRVPRN